MFSVMLTVDGGGSATVLCEGLQQDPLFVDHVVLVGVVGISWPVAERWILVQQWSVKKASILNWMVGEIRHQPELELEALVNGEKAIPWPQGSSPRTTLLNHPEALERALGDSEEQGEEEPPEE
jgi:hypothetical protein